MTERIGLSIGATNFAAVASRGATATRRSVLTLYRHRPPELGVPFQNPDIDRRGQVLTDFVDRVGNPVRLVASDGSAHRADALVADALCALMYAIADGLPPAQPATVALAALPEWSAAAGAVPLMPDAAAGLNALAHQPGLPARGVVALCDFAGTGTSVTLADAGDGLRPIGPTAPHRPLRRSDRPRVAQTRSRRRSR